MSLNLCKVFKKTVMELAEVLFAKGLKLTVQVIGCCTICQVQTVSTLHNHFYISLKAPTSSQGLL